MLTTINGFLVLFFENGTVEQFIKKSAHNKYVIFKSNDSPFKDDIKWRINATVKAYDTFLKMCN